MTSCEFHSSKLHQQQLQPRKAKHLKYYSLISKASMWKLALRVVFNLLEGFCINSVPFLFEVVLFCAEKSIVGGFYLLGLRSMDDDVFIRDVDPKGLDNSSGPSSPKSPTQLLQNVEMRTIAGHGSKDSQMTRSLSLPDGLDKTKVSPTHQPSLMNPVKEFISSFVSRKQVKKRQVTGVSTAEEIADQIPYRGHGHSFLPFSLRNPTWCDLCGEFIWGLYKQAIRCKHCKYTCHRRCRVDVDLDCLGSWPNLARNMSVDEVTMKTLHLLGDGESIKRNEPFTLISTQLPQDGLRKKVEEFNAKTTGLIMTMRDDTFQGFIRVHMNLLRPINIVAGERPLSIFEAVRSENSKKIQRTSFFLPLGTSKALHITGSTAVQEVIEALLRKFRISDNPRKFALFECYQEEDHHVILRRMTDSEKPLVLRLFWGGADIKHSFSLQENETGDIVWEVFSLIELTNFLRVLDKEEEELIQQVKEKYRNYQERLELAMELQKQKSTADSSEETSIS